MLVFHGNLLFNINLLISLGEMKMFCHNCGVKLNPGIKFCGSCGQKQNSVVENRAYDTPPAPTPPPPRSTNLNAVPPPPPPRAAGMMYGKGEHSQSYDRPPGNQPRPGYPPPGQMYSQGTGPGPVNGQGFPGQQFNPQFNQKQKSSKGCLIGILVVVVLVIILSAIGFAYLYFAADLGLPANDILGSIGILSSSPEKTVEDLFKAIANENVEDFIALITADSIWFIKEGMIDPKNSFEKELAEKLSYINKYGTEHYGKDWHKAITYKLAEEGGDRARVLATLAGETIEVILIKEDGKWKVDWGSIYGL
jgi:hypothetical protein